MKILLKSLALIILLLLQSALSFRKAYAEPETEWQFTAGVGVSTSQQPWLDAKSLTSGFPILEASYGQWNFFGNGFITYTFLEQEDFAISAGLDYRDEGFGNSFSTRKTSSKNPVFDGYQTPNGEVTANVNIKWHRFSASIQQDISNTSKGTVIEAALELPLYDSSDKFSVSSNVGVRWLNNDYVQHLYGITGEQINNTVGRTEYIASSALVPVLSIQANYVVTKNWLINSGAKLVKLDDSISDSPLVGRKEIVQLFIAGVYIF
jgi:outer membrane scaffolding protein for murein synthesis (MipA/OmpV family)